MSEDEELDKLIFSMPSFSKKKNKSTSKKDPAADDQQQSSANSAESDQAPGIDPLDVVELSGQQRKLVTWLSRHARSSIEDIEEALDIPPEELQEILGELLEEKRIRRIERNGKKLYSAPIHGNAGRRLRGFPEDLWKKAGLDDD